MIEVELNDYFKQRNKYDKILIELFQAKLADCGGEDIINFDKDDVAKVANDLNITIRNIPI